MLWSVEDNVKMKWIALFIEQKVNEMLLSNKRMYADLYARLLMADIEHEKQMHTYWKKRVEEWRRLNVNTAVADFKTFMNDPSVKEPAAVDAVMTRLIDAQASLIEQRTNCIDTLRLAYVIHG
jgi:hypothetical protein